jgi:hypothetical protein
MRWHRGVQVDPHPLGAGDLAKRITKAWKPPSKVPSRVVRAFSRAHIQAILTSAVLAKLAHQQRLERGSCTPAARTSGASRRLAGAFRATPARQVAQVGRHQAKTRHAKEVIAGEGQRGQGESSG